MELQSTDRVNITVRRQISVDTIDDPDPHSLVMEFIDDSLEKAAKEMLEGASRVRAALTGQAIFSITIDKAPDDDDFGITLAVASKRFDRRKIPMVRNEKK